MTPAAIAIWNFEMLRPILAPWIPLGLFILFCGATFLLVGLAVSGYWTRVLFWRRTPFTPYSAGTGCFAKSGWLTFVLILASICLWSIVKLDHSYSKAFLYVVVAIGILLLTFLLEGLELAYTELRDKEARQISRHSLFGVIRKYGDEFYEAREWCIVAMVVGATLMVERDTYFVPFLGEFSTDDTGGLIIRYLVTFGLTTFPLVWIAQSPAKELASRNSDHFLQLAVGDLALRFVLMVRQGVRLFRVKQPSDMFVELYKYIAPGFREERNLPPGEIRFFTDSLKKYGYAVIMGRDAFDIEEDGSASYRLRSLAYISSPKPEFSRDLAFDSKFKGDPAIRFWAFEINPVGESVQKKLPEWFQLFDSPDPDAFTHAAFRKMETRGFKSDVVAGEQRSGAPVVKGENKTVKIRFPYLLPRHNRNTQQKTATLLLTEIEGKTERGAFCAPVDLRADDAGDFYFKTYATPCLRAEVVLQLNTHSVATFCSDRYSVSFDKIEHVAESQRFAKMQRCRDGLADYDSRNTPTGGIDENGKTLAVYLESPLPGAVYQTWWSLRNVAETKTDAGQINQAVEARPGLQAPQEQIVIFETLQIFEVVETEEPSPE